MSQAIFGLLGAALGALAVIGTHWLALRAQVRGERRTLTLELVASFLDLAERLLLAAVKVRSESERLWEVQDRGEPAYADHLDELIEERDQVDMQARFIVAQMRLLRLPVAELAANLLRVTRFAEQDKLPERPQVMDAFEAGATKLIDDLYGGGRGLSRGLRWRGATG